MRKRVSGNGCHRYVSLSEFGDYMNLGRNSAKKTAVAIGAEKRIGKRCVYDLRKVDEYFSNHDSVDITIDADPEKTTEALSTSATADNTGKMDSVEKSMKLASAQDTERR